MIADYCESLNKKMASTVFHLHVLALDFCPYTCASRRLTLRKWWISWMTLRQIWIVHNGRFLPCPEKTRVGWPIVGTGNRRRSIVLPADLLHLSKLSYCLVSKFFPTLHQVVGEHSGDSLRFLQMPITFTTTAILEVGEWTASAWRGTTWRDKFLCNDERRYF